MTAPQRCDCDECRTLDKMPVRLHGIPHSYQMLLPTGTQPQPQLATRAYTLIDLTNSDDVEVAHFRTVDDAIGFIERNYSAKRHDGHLMLWDNVQNNSVNIDPPQPYQRPVDALPLFGGLEPQLF